MAQIISGLAPDIVVLSGIDYDLHNTTLDAFRALLFEQGLDLTYIFAPEPNAGRARGLDLNGDGWPHGPDDADGYADYAGARSLGILSRYPFQLAEKRDFSHMLWNDLPDALLFSGVTPEQRNHHRLSSVAHLELPVITTTGKSLRLLVYQAGPPVFGGHPDRNRNRNHDETAFWARLLDADLQQPPPKAPFVLIGGTNLDPFDGDGLPNAMRALLSHPKLQDPQPISAGAAAQANPDHAGPADQDTVEWDTPQGNLRVSYVLPSVDMAVTGAGVLWPTTDDPITSLLAQTGTAHKPVWVDIALN